MLGLYGIVKFAVICFKLMLERSFAVLELCDNTGNICEKVLFKPLVTEFAGAPIL